MSKYILRKPICVEEEIVKNLRGIGYDI